MPAVAQGQPPSPAMSKPHHPVASKRAPGDAGQARAYLEAVARIPVRFQEVDSLWIVWHGHFVTYLEEGRRALGRRYGIDYPVFLEHQVAIPVVELRVNYLAPARLDDVLIVRTRLLRSEAAKLEFEYELRREGGDQQLLATAGTVQVFTSPQGELLLRWPAFMEERLRAWEETWIAPPS
jgi:acyl-CoA thioester hydrolase